MENNVYKREEITPGIYKVLGADGTVLKNHNNKPYPHLSENISRNLIGDLNEINVKNRKQILQNTSKEEAAMEIMLHNSSSIELNESLFYCIISTLIEFDEPNLDVQIELEHQIQWDRLFRLTPGPPHLLTELKNTEKAREFFGKEYVDLPLNYCQSIDEMEVNGIDLVPEEIVDKVADLIKDMSLAERIMVDILYNLYEYFSITIPILWVAGKIGDEDFIAAYYALNRQVDIYEMDEDEYEEPRFEMNRLLYLKILKYGYRNKDETLPCVNA